MYDFLYNSSTVELHEAVKGPFESSEILEQGGVTYLFLLMMEIFKMTRDVVIALKNYLSYFSEHGIVHIITPTLPSIPPIVATMTPMSPIVNVTVPNNPPLP